MDWRIFLVVSNFCANLDCPNLCTMCNHKSQKHVTCTMPLLKYMILFKVARLRECVQRQPRAKAMGFI